MPIVLLVIILFSPIAGALLLCLVPQDRHALIRRIAVAATVPSLLGALYATLTFRPPAPGTYLHEVLVRWISSGSLNINFHLGIDGISTILVLLHALCAFTGVIVSYAIKERVK